MSMPRPMPASDLGVRHSSHPPLSSGIFISKMDLEPKPASASPRNKLSKENQDQLKSIFHLLVGKPDSTQKIFSRPIRVTLQSLIDLDGRVHEKLSAHQLNGMVASVDVAFDENTTIEFGTLSDFESHRWTTGKTTREIRMRWQFLMAIKGYEIPQQHALTIKLCSDARPIEILQALLSKHPGEDERSIISSAPLVARVDFISATVGQELIAVVGDWSDGLQGPIRPNKVIELAVKRKKEIEAMICHATPVLLALSSIAYLHRLFESSSMPATLSISDGIKLMSWLMYTLIVLYVSQKMARSLAKTSMNSLQKIGVYSVFALTNGDSMRQQTLDRINKRLLIRFVASSVLSFIINVASGVFTAVLWKGAA